MNEEKIKWIQLQLEGVVSCPDNKLHDECKDVLQKCIKELQAMPGFVINTPFEPRGKPEITKHESKPMELKNPTNP